jgi:hypothetical protein
VTGCHWLSSNITNAYIHTGRGWSPGRSSSVCGCRIRRHLHHHDTATTAQAAAIAANPAGYYINVHTTTNPTGEIRGQLTCTQPTVCRATLLGANEVPLVLGGGNGAVRLVIDAALGQIRGEWLSVGTAKSPAHIHPGAAGVNRL